MMANNIHIPIEDTTYIEFKKLNINISKTLRNEIKKVYETKNIIYIPPMKFSVNYNDKNRNRISFCINKNEIEEFRKYSNYFIEQKTHITIIGRIIIYQLINKKEIKGFCPNCQNEFIYNLSDSIKCHNCNKNEWFLKEIH